MCHGWGRRSRARRESCAPISREPGTRRASLPRVFPALRRVHALHLGLRLLDERGQTQAGGSIFLQQYLAALDAPGHSVQPVEGIELLEHLAAALQLGEKLLDLRDQRVELVRLRGQELLPLLLDGVHELLAVAPSLGNVVVHLAGGPPKAGGMIERLLD